MEAGGSLPDDCLEQCVHHLDVASLARASQVCKRWHAVAEAPGDVWLQLYERCWGDTEMIPEGEGEAGGGGAEEPDVARVKQSFKQRLQYLSELPDLLIAWSNCAAQVERCLVPERQEGMKVAQRCTENLMTRADHCSLALSELALGVVGGRFLDRMIAGRSAADVALMKRGGAHAKWLVKDRKLARIWRKLFTAAGSGEPDLEGGALLICEIGDDRSREEREEVCRELDTIADEVRGRLAPDVTCVKTVVAAMNHVLFNDRGFRGNVDNYYDPRNSFITDVIRRRTGIPISLAVVYMCVANRLGVRIQGVNAPSHFLLKVVQPRDVGNPASMAEEYFIDVFDQGRLLTIEGVQALLASFGWPSDRVHLPPCSNQSVFCRMLRNLTSIYQPPEPQGQIMGSDLKSKFILCLSQLLVVVSNTDHVLHYERQIDEYRWTGTARILNP